MKLFTFLMIVATMNLSAGVYSQDTKISLKHRQTTLAGIIEAIENQSEFRIFYKTDQIDTRSEIRLDEKEGSIASVLSSALQGSDITYKVLDKLIVLTPSATAVQPVKVSGTITDSETGLPMPGVNILVDGTNIGSISDSEGKYTIQAPNANATLVFSFIGYTQKRVEMNGRTNIDVQMDPDVKALDEVVVIGYGTRSKRDVTTSISSVDATQIEKSVAMSPDLAMQGRMTGVLVTGNSGNPMERPTVRIRGVNTWGVSSPLYVIDGIPITELGSGIEGQEDARVSDVRGPINIMTLIDPNDIESISVLKDASAAAIYGVRAANGVILITTKRGRSEKPTVEFSARYGVQNVPNKWDVLNTQQYVNFYEKSFAANPAQTLDPVFDPDNGWYLGNTTETYDWQTPLINKNAPNEEYYFRVSGGNDKSNYFFSTSYNNTEGVLINERLKRYSFSTKINSQITDWLTAGINYRLAFVKGKDNNRFDITDRAQTPPWQPIYDETGNHPFLKGYAPGVVGFDSSDVWNNAKLYGEGTRINAFGEMALRNTNYQSLRNLGNVYAQIEPIKGLTIKGNVSIDWYKNDRYQFEDYNRNWFDYTSGSPLAKGGGKSVGQYGERYTTNYNIVQELTVNYTKVLGDHNLDVLLSAMDQQYGAKYVGGSTEYLTTDVQYLLNLGGDRQYTDIGSDNFRWALEGLLARVGYNYKYKYYIDLTVRRDGSSRFAPGHRWGTFPSASIAWRLTSEPFMENVNWMTDFKFRAGWGQLGNQEVRNMAYVSTISPNPSYAYGSYHGSPNEGLGIFETGAAMFSFPNPDLEWEKTSTTNIGFDAVLFTNLSFSFEYYDKTTDGILQETSIPPSVGSKNNPVANIAKVKNNGIETTIDFSKTIGDFGFNVGGNLTTIHNEVLSTYNNIPFGTNDQRIETGYPIHYIYGYELDGIFQNQAQIDEWLLSHTDLTISQSYQPGDMYFKDVNGPPSPDLGYEFYTPMPDSIVNDFDRTYIGKTIPGFFYGFHLGANWKGFDFSAFFQGVGDVDKYNSARAALENLGTRGNNLRTTVLNAWTAENHSTTMPRAIVGDPNKNGRYSSRFVESAAYLRLGNAQIGYTIPPTIMGKLGMQSLRIYGSVSNAFVITPWDGLDPENDYTPIPRVFTIGLSARF